MLVAYSGEKHLCLHCLDCDLSYHIHLIKCPMWTVLLKFSNVSKIYKTKSRPSINKRANIAWKIRYVEFWQLKKPLLTTCELIVANREIWSKAYSEVMFEPFLDSSLISVCKCMIIKYKVDNFYTLYIVSRGFTQIILKSSMLEASTRARTGDSAETIKLFENTFLCPQLRRSWGGILIWASACVRLSVRPSVTLCVKIG